MYKNSSDPVIFRQPRDNSIAIDRPWRCCWRQMERAHSRHSHRQTWASTPHIASPAISDNRALAQARPDVLQRQRDHELRTAESVNAIVVRRPNPPRKDCSRK